MHVSIFLNIIGAWYDSFINGCSSWKFTDKRILGLLRSLQDAGEPELDKLRGSLRTTEAKELSNGDKDSLLRFMGLPLWLFEKGSFFQPYLPLQQIDILSSEKTRSYIAGTTNQIFFHQKSNTNIDVLVNVHPRWNSIFFPCVY